MIEKIIVGILIGLVAGFLIPKNGIHEKGDSSNSIQIFIAVISIAFIGSSFMYGAIFGLMAIGEIMVGFVVASRFSSKK